MVLPQTDRVLAQENHLVRCIVCGEVTSELAVDFRCANCGELLEVEFPAWATASSDAGDALKAVWRERRTSHSPLDTSGVWRFREMLPALSDWSHVITLREGNTPLYDLRVVPKRGASIICRSSIKA